MRHCRSSLLVCASCWGSQRPRGVAASLTLRETARACSWRERAVQVSGRTASPTSSSWMTRVTEQEAGMNHNSKGAQQKPNCVSVTPLMSCQIMMTPMTHTHTHTVGHTKPVTLKVYSRIFDIGLCF